MGAGAAAAPDSLRRFVESCIAAGRMTAASWWAGRNGSAVAHGGAGRLSQEADARPVSEETPFDLASLTKALATAPLLVLEAGRGTLDLDAPVASLLAECRGTPLGERTLAALATHTAGLPPWAPLFLRARGVENCVECIAGLSASVPAGTTVYSDLGYIVLGAAIERATGRDLSTLFHERVAGPLELRRIGFARAPLEYADAAATERGNQFEREMAGEEGARHSWRERIPPGEVHDANAYALGGVAGHAGLFGTAADVARIASELIAPRRLALDETARRRLLCAGEATDARTIGMVLAAHAAAARGVLPPDAPGHTGFTGTSFWLEPDRGACYVLLTNRVHPRVPRLGFQSVRRAFHRLASRATATGS